LPPLQVTDATAEAVKEREWRMITSEMLTTDKSKQQIENLIVSLKGLQLHHHSYCIPYRERMPELFSSVSTRKLEQLSYVR
jgi:hypothetical protein